MKIKLITIDGKTYAEVSDGKPVYVDDDGKEIAFDAPATRATITRLNGEAKGHRERAEAAEGKLKAFDGIDDPEAARKAIGIVKNIDDKKLMDAGKVDEIKTAAIQAVEAKYAPIVAERDKLAGPLNNEIIGGSFSRSKFIADKVAVPPTMMQATFGNRFKVEDGKLVPYDAAGNKLFSRAKPGEIADFDEAIELMVAADPFKDRIMKGGGSGTGAQGGAGATGGKQMTRAQFEGMAPGERVAAMKGGTKIVDA